MLRRLVYDIVTPWLSLRNVVFSFVFAAMFSAALFIGRNICLTSFPLGGGAPSLLPFVARLVPGDACYLLTF